MSALFALSACSPDRPNRHDESASGEPAQTAVIRVVAGDGRLAGGEEYRIAEWRSGLAGSLAFADFRGQDGGPTLDLSLRGLGQVGTFTCGEAAAPVLEVRVDVDHAYRIAADEPCRIVVTRLSGGVIEGRYAATLRHTGSAGSVMTVEGSFRAGAPDAPNDPSADIQAAEGPRLGLR